MGCIKGPSYSSHLFSIQVSLIFCLPSLFTRKLCFPVIHSCNVSGNSSVLGMPPTDKLPTNLCTVSARRPAKFLMFMLYAALDTMTGKDKKVSDNDAVKKANMTATSEVASHYTVPSSSSGQYFFVWRGLSASVHCNLL